MGTKGGGRPSGTNPTVAQRSSGIIMPLVGSKRRTRAQFDWTPGAAGTHPTMTRGAVSGFKRGDGWVARVGDLGHRRGNGIVEDVPEEGGAPADYGGLVEKWPAPSP
jgi:hypothetical protein